MMLLYAVTLIPTLLAKVRHPERWTGSTRDWVLDDKVWLNPERSKDESKPKESKAS